MTTVFLLRFRLHLKERKDICFFPLDLELMWGTKTSLHDLFLLGDDEEITREVQEYLTQERE